jgi:HAD superfamily hydrolase (TIGR01450 family)
MWPARTESEQRLIRTPATITDDLQCVPDRLYDAYFFDMDGTIYLGDELLPGAQRLIAALHSMEKRVRFLTNNPRLDPDQYAAKLHRLGIQAESSEIITAAMTVAMWLGQNHPDATVYPIGEPALWKAVRDANIRISTEPAEIDFVIASVDRSLTYDKLQVAFDAIWFHQRAKLIRTNPGRYCPVAGGRAELDTGAVVGAIEATTGVGCSMDTGKPNPIMLNTVLEEIGFDAAECVMTGDLLRTDVQMARAAGMPAALVLTGETTREQAAVAPDERRPDFILDRIDQLLPPHVWEELGISPS